MSGKSESLHIERHIEDGSDNSPVGVVLNAYAKLDQIELERQRRLEKLMFDPLTNCPDRKWVSSYCKKIFNPKEADNKFSVWVIDFNELKHTNDTGGHSAGDTLIKKGVEAMQKEFDIIDSVTLCDYSMIIDENRPMEIDGQPTSVQEARDILNNSNMLIRTGGDEFTIWFKEEYQEDCNKESLVASTAKFESFTKNLKDEQDISLAFGGVLFSYEKYGYNILAAHDEADKRMYQQKQATKFMSGRGDNTTQYGMA